MKLIFDLIDLYKQMTTIARGSRTNKTADEEMCLYYGKNQ